MIARLVRGCKDILPKVTPLWRKIEKEAFYFLSCWGLKEIRTPILEQEALFIRALGETTDVVEKQMFSLQKGDDRLVLRPEGTAAVVRAVCENGLLQTDPNPAYFYIGPMFRGERPQKGRLRQFHHIGVEIFSTSGVIADADPVILLWELTKYLGVSGAKVKINSLGCQEDRERYVFLLKKKLSVYKERLCPDCQRRLDKNVLRVLDCKNLQCREVVAQLDINYKTLLCESCFHHFEGVCRLLQENGVELQKDIYLVRGLDYYTGIVFELVHPNLGKGQDALAAGGRYDDLVEEISSGKWRSPAIGFAIGVERLILAMDSVDFELDDSRKVVVIWKQGFENEAYRILLTLRRNGIPSLMIMQDKSFKAQMRWANKLGARFVLIIGEDEAGKGVISVKDMDEGGQQQMDIESFTTLYNNVIKK